jgi:peroxiredoxin
VEVVAISMDETEDAASMAELVGAEYPVLSDPGGSVVRAYGVYDLLGDGVAAPAVFIVGKDRAIQWQQVGGDIADRPSATQILLRLDAPGS